MGRTNRTYRDRLEAAGDDLQTFRRALRHRDQGAFDDLFEHARQHADAAGHANLARDLDAIYLSVLVAQQRQINQLLERLDE